MNLSEIPYRKIGIKEDDGERIVKTIQKISSERPHNSIEIQTITDAVGLPAIEVKKIFYMLLGLKLLKATFIPRHKACDHVIGTQEHSVGIIMEKVNQGTIDWCNYCQEPINGPEDIDIQIIFWKPGINVE